MRNSTIISRAAALLATLFMLTSLPQAAAQVVSGDQRLITLNNGFQYLGYVLEQRPGKDLKLYRPTANDTIIVKLDDIRKVTRIEIKSTDTRSSKQLLTTDTILRIVDYNNKKHTFQFSILSGVLFQDMTKPLWPSPGFGIGYYRSFNNKFFLGGSYQRYNSLRDMLYYTNKIDGVRWQADLNILMAEGRIRLSAKPQNRRISALIGLQAGYMHSYAYIVSYAVNQEIQTFQINSLHNIVAGGSFCFRINTDRNTGWSIEPTVACFRPRIITYYYDGTGTYYDSAADRKLFTNFGLRVGHYF